MGGDLVAMILKKIARTAFYISRLSLLIWLISLLNVLVIDIRYEQRIPGFSVNTLGFRV